MTQKPHTEIEKLKKENLKLTEKLKRIKELISTFNQESSK